MIYRLYRHFYVYYKFICGGYNSNIDYADYIDYDKIKIIMMKKMEPPMPLSPSLSRLLLPLLLMIITIGNHYGLKVSTQ